MKPKTIGEIINQINEAKQDLAKLSTVWIEKHKESPIKIKETAAEMERRIDLAHAEANNAIWFGDSSDYLPALYQVCKLLFPENDAEKIGTEYIARNLVAEKGDDPE